MAEFRRDGLRLNADIAEGRGRGVLFQHGLCGDARQTAEAFPANPAFRRLTLECRGHGASESGDPRQFTIAAFADDVAAFIEAEPARPIAVGGISMGAAIALRLAVTRPDLVPALILARPAWVTGAAPPNMAVNAEVGGLLRRFPAAEAKRRFLESATARELASDAPDNLASLTGFFAREPADVTAELLCRIAADGPGVGADDLARIPAPTLVIGHGSDAIHPLALAEALARRIPNATLTAITPKAESRERYAAEFRAALDTFLKELP